MINFTLIIVGLFLINGGGILKLKFQSELKWITVFFINGIMSMIWIGIVIFII